jgi:polyferredoxin
MVPWALCPIAWRGDATHLRDGEGVDSMSNERPAAMAEFKRMMKWIALAGVVMVIGALWYLSLYVELNFVIVTATIAGVFLSVLLGCGLFAAAFFSDKSGHDQSVTNATRHAEDKDGRSG